MRTVSCVLLVLGLVAGCTAGGDADGVPVDGAAAPSADDSVTAPASVASADDASTTGRGPTAPPTASSSGEPPVDPTTVPTARAVRRIVGGMSDARLAAQLLVVPVFVDGTIDVLGGTGTSDPSPAQWVEELQPGGVVFLGRGGSGFGGAPLPVVDRSDGARLPPLIARIQRRADVPLLVAMDQEHGTIVRLGLPFTRFPSAMALGATGDARLVRRVAAAAGREMATAGVTVNLAPVADVNTEPSNPVIGVRSPGQVPDHVAAVVTAMVRGLQDDAGIAATVKHFPGHGDTTVDSHDALPTVSGTLDEIRDTALVPFAAAVRAGADLVMPGHLLLADVDATGPATLSAPLLRRLLRDRLGFEGVVISDSMSMGAIRRGDGVDPAVSAIAAGVDLILMPPDPVGTRDAIVAAIDDGTLERRQVVASVERVLALKGRLGLLRGHDRDGPRVPRAGVLRRHSSLAAEAGTSAATMLDGPCPSPLAGEDVVLTGDVGDEVADLFGDAGINVTDAADTRVHVWDGRGAAPRAPDAVVVVAGSPYAAGRVPSSGSLITTYDGTVGSVAGLAAALAAGTFTAHSPVAIPRHDGSRWPVGTGVDCPGTLAR